jgi:hypothetical protein
MCSFATQILASAEELCTMGLVSDIPSASPLTTLSLSPRLGVEPPLGPFTRFDSYSIKINLLKPTGYFMHLFALYLSQNKQRLVSHHKLIGFYNRDEKCLQHGTDWVFK